MQLVEKLPQNWIIEPLGAVCSIERGITFPSSAKKDVNTDDTVACLRTTNVQEYVDWEDLIFVPTTYVRSSDKIIRQGDTLISLANSASLVGKVSYVDEVKRESTFGGFISVIRAGEHVDSYFLYSFLNSRTIQATLRSWASQTTNIANLTTRDLTK